LHKKKLEAAHHKFQRMMGIYAWKDRVSNERFRAQIQLEKIGRKREKTEMARARSANG